MSKRHSYFIVIGIAVALLRVPPASAQQSCQAIGCLDAAQSAPIASNTLPLPRPSTTIGRDETAPDARYQLKKGDVIELNFPFVPTFNQTVTIQPDGYVTVPELGALRVDGLTVPELTETLRAQYASILRDPTITVVLKEFEKPYFIVAGEVERPGKYDLRGETTVTEAVAIAGGLKDRAKHSEAAVFRRLAGGGFETKTLDLKKMLKEARLGEDVQLVPGDILFIPRGRHVSMSELTSLTSSLWILRFFY
jgi:polysaccharide export outer membrane protein